MAVVKFTLSEDGVTALRDALNCLNRFSDELSFEARKDKLVLTALNSSKSGYASFSFAANRFFSRYKFGSTGQYREKFFCKLYNKSLLSLFRPRTGDPVQEREKDTIIDHCDVAVVDDPGRKSRFHVNIIFRNGITTKYRLPYEIRPPVYAKFSQDEASSRWSISSRTLRTLVDHFGPGIDYLDIHSEDDSLVNFTCFTEKVVNGDEILKKPLHTSIAVERDEFESFAVAEDDLHIIVSVKDFRAIILHASPQGSCIEARYSTPSHPMQLKYDSDAIKCEFLLMTVGERANAGQKMKRGKGSAKAQRPAQLDSAHSRATSRAPSAHPPPPPQPSIPRQPGNVPALRPQISRPSQRPPPATLQEDSLFVPQDNDQQWDPVNLDEGDEEENARLEWDASLNPPQSATNMRSIMSQKMSRNTNESAADDDRLHQIDPTQRLSDVRKFGLFGD